MQKSDADALNDYWSKQPELQDPEFVAILSEEKKKHQQNPTHRIMHVWELAKFRLKKMLPSTMPFEERKRLLLGSEAWNCWVYQNNKHLSVDEITEDNIEKEIENVGISWGIDIEKRYNTLKWIFLATNEAMCEVYISPINILDK